MAIEDGGPIPGLVGQLQKLQAEKSEAEMALQRLLLASSKVVDLDRVARAIRDFSCNCRPAFEGGTTIEKEEIVRGCVDKVIVDREQKAVMCYIRRFPLAGDPADDLIESLKEQRRHHQKR